MKIGIDARTLETGHKYRGIGIFSKNLIEAISKIDKDNDYVFYTQQTPSAASKLVNSDFRYEDCLVRHTTDPTKYNWYLDQFAMPRAVIKSDVDIVHYLEQLSCPYYKPTKTIVTINDHFQVIGKDANIKNKIKFKAATRADKIITISNYIKRELTKIFNISADKIVVTHLGFDKNLYKPIDNPELIKKFRQNITQGNKYLLYVGSLGDFDRRKNLDFLVECFKEFAKINNKISLVIVGKIGFEGQRIRELFNKHGLKNRVVFTDFVDFKDLPIYFQAAEAFLFPSLGEGFGLPPLEAMASGCPVISSNATSLPEVVGDAGLLLNPTDLQLWVKNISEIVNNSQMRQKLSKDGLTQADKFSWQRCAEETIKVYKEVANAKN